VDQSFFGVDDAKLSFKGDGFGVGYNLGILLFPGEKFSFAFAYRSKALLAEWTAPELQVWHFIGTGLLKGLLGEVEQYETLVKMAQEQTEKHGLTFLYPLTQLHRLMSLGYAGKYAAAVEAALDLLNLPSFPIIMKGVAAKRLAMFYYHTGDLPAARQFVEKARQILVKEISQGGYLLSSLKMAAAMISYHLGELDPATEEELQETLRQVTGISSYLMMAEAHWVLALWRWRQGKLKVAAGHIKAGMQIAARRGSYFSVVLSPRDRGRVFTLALELGVEEVWESLPPLLVKLSDWTRPDLERLSRHANPKIAAKAREIRLAVHRAGVPRLRLQTLGGFRLLCGDAPIDQERWEGQKSIRLLKALIAHGAREVPKDVLMEALWP
jgi:LuxR family maltose regulon positive regulatory protein